MNNNEIYVGKRLPRWICQTRSEHDNRQRHRTYLKIQFSPSISEISVFHRNFLLIRNSPCLEPKTTRRVESAAT
jgi:hypothetical protein